MSFRTAIENAAKCILKLNYLAMPSWMRFVDAFGYTHRIIGDYSFGSSYQCDACLQFDFHVAYSAAF